MFANYFHSIGNVYHPNSVNYFNRAGITASTEIRAVNTLVLSLISNNLWDACYALWLCSPTSYGASLHNLKSSSYLLSATVAPSFSISGWQGNGLTQFLKTGLVPNTVTALDSATFGVRSRTSGQDNGAEMGTVSGTGIHTYMRARATTNLARLSYTTNATLFDAVSTDGSGNFFWGAIASNSRYIRRNTVSLSASSAAHGSTPGNLELYILARNSIGTADLFSARELCGAWVFSGLTTAQCDILSGIFDTYNTNVIPGGR